MGFAFRLADRRLIFLSERHEAKKLTLSDTDFSGFKGWASRYATILRSDRNERSISLDPLLAIGNEITAWLDPTGWMADLGRDPGPLTLVIAVADDRTDLARAFLGVPWEVMATPQGFLAMDADRPFCIQRCIGQEALAPQVPRFQSLNLIFMAASPRTASPVLNYEAEEAAILKATEDLPLTLTVEESGCLDFLAQRMTGEASFEALHLSCHGHIIDGTPKLMLESAEGDRADASAADIVSALGTEKTGLIFLAACGTAEHETQSAPLAMDLVRAGVSSVLGWDGSVLDTDATEFARYFYTALARSQTPAFAAASARQALLKAHLADPNRKTCRHWHMARLYVSASGGGGPLCDASANARPTARGAAYHAFLDKERAHVPVAGPMAFVGRRREAQEILRVFRSGSHPGVLIHAFGGQGKSSLAARIAGRLQHHRTAVVFGDYRARAIFDAVLTALAPEQRGGQRDLWDKRLDDDDGLRDALEAILSGPCAVYDPACQRRPLLLVIDDLEQVLEAPQPGAARSLVKTEYRAPLAAVIEAFDHAQRTANSEARLILTSRYDFALPNSRGTNLAELLHKVPLRPFDGNEQRKQQHAARAELSDTAASATPAIQREALLARVRRAALGNPLIQATLTRFVLAEPETAEAAIRAMEAYNRRSETHDLGLLAEIFERLTLDHYHAALSTEENAAFRALTLFAIPVPEQAMLAAAGAVGEADAAFARFLRLGMVDRFEARSPQKTEYMASQLARPLFALLSDHERRRLSQAVLPALIGAWTGENDFLVKDVRALEVWRLAQVAGDAEAMAKAALFGGDWLFQSMRDAKEALRLLRPTIDELLNAGIRPDASLLALAVQCAGFLGEARLQDLWLDIAPQSRGDDPGGEGRLLLVNAIRKVQLGLLEEAQDLLERALACFVREHDAHHMFLTIDRIAEIFLLRGDLDEALRIRREDQVPVLDRLNDSRLRAYTMGKIADILQIHGELDEALRIRREEQLPIQEELGDIRERAVTIGKIADILQLYGDLDEALRIRREEQLPVFERLGEIRERAVALGKIADILQIRDDLDEALRIRHEQLRVYERLGDVREHAFTRGRIAEILAMRDEPEKALRIFHDELIPIFKQLNDIHSQAITYGHISDILVARGDGDEALRICREEALPLLERLNHAYGRADTLAKIADILVSRGDLDEALRICREDVLPVYERLRTMPALALTMVTIADILFRRGDLDEALRILQNDVVPVLERLHEVHGRALVMRRIAEILHQRGHWDEALRILRVEQLPVFRRLGCLRDLAGALDQMADIFTARGDLDEALRIRCEEELPLLERLDDARGRAVAIGKIGDIDAARGRINEAIARYTQACALLAPLDAIRDIAMFRGRIANIFYQYGHLDEALRICEDECLPIARRLGDAAGVASILLKTSRIRGTQKSITDPPTFERILQDLLEAYALTKKLPALELKCAAASDFGQFLAAAGMHDQARTLLKEAREGYRKLSWGREIALMEELLSGLPAPAAAVDSTPPPPSKPSTLRQRFWHLLRVKSPS